MFSPPAHLQVAQFTVTKERMTEFSMVYYNNLLSIGPVLLLMALFGEFQVRSGGDSDGACPLAPCVTFPGRPPKGIGRAFLRCSS